MLRDIEEEIERDQHKEVADIEAKLITGELGQVAAAEETAQVRDSARKKLEEIRTIFALADPSNLTKRVSLRYFPVLEI